MLSKQERAARTFAKNAQPGVIYYQPRTYPEPCGRGKLELLSEIVFDKPSRWLFEYPRWYGPLTAYDCYLKRGQLYEDRGHRAIRRLLTVRERMEEDEKFEAMMLGSPAWAEEVALVVPPPALTRHGKPTSRYRSTW